MQEIDISMFDILNILWTKNISLQYSESYKKTSLILQDIKIKTDIKAIFELCFRAEHSEMLRINALLFTFEWKANIFIYGNNIEIHHNVFSQVGSNFKLRWYRNKVNK